jgi:hypothetical protein
MKLILSIIVFLTILIIIKDCEEPFISKVIESKKVKYLTNYKMGVDYYNNEAGKISNFLSNVLKFKVVGANPKKIIENVSNSKFDFGIVKENLLQDAFFGKGVFNKKHLNLRIVSRMFPISLFFISKSMNENQIKGFNDIKKIKDTKNLTVGIYSPKYKFSNKISSDEKDPSILIFYKLFDNIGMKMGKKKGEYQLEIYKKRDKLLESLKNKQVDFCAVFDVFNDNDLLKNWSKDTTASEFHIFGLNDLSDYELKFMFPRMKISNLDLTFKPYDKDNKSNINKELVNAEIVMKIMEYLFKQDNYFWTADKYKNLTNRDKLFNEQRLQWNILRNDNISRNLTLLRNQLTNEKKAILSNIDISTTFLNKNKAKILLYLQNVKEKKNRLKKSVSNTKQKQIYLDKEVKDLEKEKTKVEEKLKENKENKTKISGFVPKSMNSIDKLKDNIKFIIIEKNKLLNEKNEITYRTEVLNFGAISGNKNFPFWNPFIVNELKNLNYKSFLTFIDNYKEKILKDIKKQELEIKNTKDKTGIGALNKKIQKLKIRKNDFDKYTTTKPKSREPTGYLDITKNKNPMSKRGIAPVTFKTLQEYYVLFSEEDVRVPPVYNVLYALIKLPNDIKSSQKNLLIKTDYNLPLHPAVKVLYEEYNTEENVEDTCRNRIGDMECIIKHLK